MAKFVAVTIISFRAASVLFICRKTWLTVEQMSVF